MKSKTFFFGVFILLFAFQSNARVGKVLNENIEKILIDTTKDIKIPAQFPGGQYGWIRFVESNLDVNLPVRNGAPVGRFSVKIRFTVGKDGTLADINAENDPGYGMADEAIRILEISPKWIPASVNGVNVNYKNSQAIIFLVSNY